ncbi:hypothetical protein PRIPAC_81450 [Pristionchus pacificus]|uniref:Uncharacterized protein n=1 Tax=Pristionchus pacificus TaxID=54126 RepID=A0A2A6BHW2_PRIPA|nr:hypothetical protein PRIPAC_81450 [Pristionchus pacificus]|eukprot:PDM65484.1 hypothetical protein PRIPAC_52426 [Pristionchus pacificus]
MLPTLLLLSVTVSTVSNTNSTVPFNSTVYSPSNSTSNSTSSSDPIVIICPREWFTNDSCVVATNETIFEIDVDDDTQCTRAHSSLYLCLSHPVTSLMGYRDEIEELLEDDEDYY